MIALVLYCGGNKLTSLDVSQNTYLTRLDCYGNQLTSLDVSKNKALVSFSFIENPMTSIDISNNRLLYSLGCYDTPGDGVSKFPVKAWFDNGSIPAGFNSGPNSWVYGGKTITVEYIISD